MLGIIEDAAVTMSVMMGAIFVSWTILMFADAALGTIRGLFKKRD
jgi:hypothetical protein